MKLELHSDFQSINPFAEQSPFLLFYNKGAGDRRTYQVNGLGCVTPDLFQATRYEIDRYDEKLGYVGDGRHTPIFETIPPGDISDFWVITAYDPEGRETESAIHGIPDISACS
jgi:hypothetical protein